MWNFMYTLDTLFGIYLALGVLLILASFGITLVAVKNEGYWIEITEIHVFKMLAVIVFWPVILVKSIVMASESPESESFVEFLCRNGDFTMAEDEAS